MATTSRRARSRLALALVTGLFALACGEHSGRPATGGDPPAARDVRMPDGRVVQVRSRAQRVFPASSSVVDFLVELVPQDRLAVLPDQAFDYATFPGGAAAWQGVPRFTAYTAETVLAATPDLVIAEPWQDRNTSDRLRGSGIEVVVLPEVRDWKEARATLVCVGDLLGLRAKAEELANALDARVAALAERPGPRRGLRALSYSNFGTGGSSAGPGTTLHEQLGLAGMRNAYAELGREGHAALTFEELIALDPDLIVVSQPLRAGEGTQGDRGGASGRLLRAEPALRTLRAVRLDRIVEMPARLFATGSHHIVDGAEALATAADLLLGREAPPEPRR